MIRFARQNDLDQIIKLWEICFPDDAEFTDWYFNNQYCENNTLVFEKDGFICGALQRIPYFIKNIGQATYIYGACTHPDFRKKGIMAEMLDYSDKIDIERGINATFLVPQSEELFRFYEKFNYKPAFKLNHKIYNKISTKPFPSVFRKCNKDDIKNLNSLYESVLKDCNYVLRSDEYWKEQIELLQFFGGDVYCLENENEFLAYAFFIDDFANRLQELVGVNEEVKEIISNELIKEKGFHQIETTIVTAEDNGDYFGCIKFHNEQVELKKLPFVMNLMFD